VATLNTPQALIARWDELCRDSSLDDLPYKVELSTSGKLELSPRTVRRGLLVADLATQLQEKLPGGIVAISCAVLTRTGIRVPDVVWVSHQAWPRDDAGNLLERAPELCIEVCSLDREEKVPAYLSAGAREVWVVSEDASIRYFDTTGERKTTDFPVMLTWPPAKDWMQ
jgi:Uma2 family endonuclease